MGSKDFDGKMKRALPDSGGPVLPASQFSFVTALQISERPGFKATAEPKTEKVSLSCVLRCFKLATLPFRIVFLALL